MRRTVVAVGAAGLVAAGLVAGGPAWAEGGAAPAPVSGTAPGAADASSAAPSEAADAEDRQVSRGGSAGRAKIKVSGIRLSRSGRFVDARIAWHQTLLDKPGKDDLDLRALVVDEHGDSRVLAANPGSLVPDSGNVTNLHLPLRRSTARLLRTAREVTVTATQSHDSAADKDRKFESNYVTVVHLRPGQTRSAADAQPRATWTTYVPAGRLACSGKKVESYANLTGCNLTGADLRNAQINHLNLKNANLTGDNLSGANINQSTLDGATFSYANLVATDLSFSTGLAIVMQKAVATNANISYLNTSTNPGGALPDLSGTNFTSASLNGAQLAGANMAGTKLTSADLSSANLENVNLTGSSWLNGADLGDTDLSGADLSLAILSGPNPVIQNTNFRSARLNGAVFDSDTPNALPSQGYYSDSNKSRWMQVPSFYGADLTGASFRGVRVFEGDFWHANMNGTDFSYAYMDGSQNTSATTSFTAATMTNTNLTGSYLYWLVWNGAVLSNVNLTGASVVGGTFIGVTGCSSVIGHASIC